MHASFHLIYDFILYFYLLASQQKIVWENRTEKEENDNLLQINESVQYELQCIILMSFITYYISYTMHVPNYF